MGIVSSKKLKEVDEKVDGIIKILETNVKYKAEQYDKITSFLSNLQLEVDIKKKINDLGNYDYVVSYSIPNVVLSFDEQGDLIQNRVFESINFLNLISFEDMRAFSRIISEEKSKAKKK